MEEYLIKIQSFWDIMLCEISQSQKDESHTIPLTWNIWKWKWSHSVVSDSATPRPWDSPAGILERVAISFSRESSRHRDRTQVSRIGGRRFNLWATREASYCWVIEFLIVLLYEGFVMVALFCEWNGLLISKPYVSPWVIFLCCLF